MTAKNRRPNTGQFLKGDLTEVNIADKLEAMYNAMLGQASANPVSVQDTAMAALIGALAATAVTDPTASASNIALLKGLLKQLQGSGSGAAPVSLSGSIVTLADAVTTTGTKTSISVGWANTLRLNVYGTGAFSVKVQGVMYDGVSYDLPSTNAISGAEATNVIAAGIYDWDVSGFVTVNLYVTTVGTNVSAKGALLT